MSALVVVDFTPLNKEKMQEYGASAAATIAQHGGEFIAKGQIESLAGEASHKMKAVIQFTDLEAAKRWYLSDEYQAIIPLREQGMDAKFHLVG